MMKRIIKTMTISSSLCLVLIIARFEWSGSLAYVFLIWNLFLAWVPFLCSICLTEAAIRNKPNYILALWFVVWLVFFPNSPYIVTDLFHLHQKRGIPLWFDLVLILSFAWNGLLLGFVSLFEVQHFLGSYFKARVVNAFIIFLMVLCSFGIYLGRYPRWNSWDIISNPFGLSGDILNMLLHPTQNTRMIGVTFFFSLFLLAAYGTLRSMISHFNSMNHGQEKI
jgi:uncharacterized membrane protein